MDIQSLVLAAKKGDNDAFYSLINDSKTKLYKIAYSYLRNEADSLEAIQETTYRAFTKINKLKEPKFFNTWLVRILINYCHDEIKRKKRIVFTKVDQIASTQIKTDRVEIEEAIHSLTPKYQSVIILKYLHDLTIHDIAEIMEKPEGTIKTWLNKALKELRKQIGEVGELYA